ncbi:unnamed protein product [Mytilus edulis]|uniref:Novel STAND NTPase 3 domain-containing protein n=1 Tax=Mytilus edulis TaxID=6550 RepID=A0A8S3T2U6_MYTED|nr:unnamed protein product [Mytilus edulis]
MEKVPVAKTRAIRRLEEMIRKDDVAVAVGPSGCGKSTAIHFIALQLELNQEYEIIISHNPEDMRMLFNPDNKQVFVIDDVFGIVTFDENKAYKWLEMSNDIKRLLKGNHTKVLASCKTHIFQHRIAKTIKILSKFSCDFVSTQYCLTDEERLKIAKLYLTKMEIRDLMSAGTLPNLYLFPVLCRYYSNQKTGITVSCHNNETRYRISDPTGPFDPYEDERLFKCTSLHTAERKEMQETNIARPHQKVILRRRKFRYQRPKTHYIYPLHIAVYNGNIEIVKLLLLHNAKSDFVETRPQIVSPLAIALNRGFVDILQVLLERTTSIIFQKSENLSQACLEKSLKVAVEKGYYNVVSLLLNHTTDTSFLVWYPRCDFTDTKESNNYTKIKKLLLECRCGPYVCQKDNTSPFSPFYLRVTLRF